MFDAFKKHGAQYCFPADLTLFGNDSSSSKTLVLRAISKHYPHLLQKYRGYFENSNEMPPYYRKAFYKKMQELGVTYSLRNKIIA